MITGRKKTLIIIFCFLIVVFFTGINFFLSKKYINTSNNNIKVAIVSQVEIDPIVELRNGFVEAFQNSTYAKSRKVNIQYYTAQGDNTAIRNIANQVALSNPDLVYVLGTSMAQAIQKRDKNLLLVQGAVTDPVEANLAKSWEGSGKRYIATSDLTPIDKQIELIQELTPWVHRLGLIYNPGEPNSVAVIRRLRNYLVEKNANIRLVDGPIASSSDVILVMQSFYRRADAIFMPPDNTAASAMSVIGRYARDYRIPFYATNSTVLEKGALAVVSLDFVQLGRESAYLALEVLNDGADPAKIPGSSRDRVGRF